MHHLDLQPPGEPAKKQDECDLCGLSLAAGGFEADFNGQIRRFCCTGCRMVFAMLLEAGDVSDPADFKQTELFRRCLAAGVIPSSAEEAAAARGLTPSGRPLPGEPATESGNQGPALTFQSRVAGMWCPACAWVIENALSRLAGVHSVVCDFSIDRLQCRYDPTRIAPAELSAAVVRLGYGLQPDIDQEQRRLQHDSVALAVTAILSANVMMLSWALYSGFFTELTPAGIRYLSWPVFLLATAVMFYGGGPVIRKAWSGLRSASPGMEVLVVLGAGSAYGLSLANFVRGSIHLYFDTASMLLALLLLGKWLEARAKRRVRRDLEGFLSLLPGKARLCSGQFPNGRYVAAARLRRGDRITISADDMVPADGRVIEGRATLDVSAITGEPAPVPIGGGDTVIGGSRLIDGRLDVRVEVVGEESLLGQMIRVVQGALSRKSLAENRAMRRLALFVPLIMTLAFLTGVVVYVRGTAIDLALERAITVLVVACPCTLAIAVPLARVAGISGAGRRGLLVRDVAAFDQAGKIDSVIFDKTGTLTEGKWVLDTIAPQAELTDRQALALALALERDVDHTVARAIAHYARHQMPGAAEVTGIEQTPEGVAGIWHTRRVRIGSRRFAAGKHCQDDIRPTGGSQVYLSVDGRIEAIFYFGDRLRPSAGALIAALKAMGFRVHLLSGDTPAATRQAAEALGIDRYQGGLRPHEKASYIAALAAQGAQTAMLGDGINDAAALARADLAIAVHGGAALVHQVGALTLMRGDPLQLLDFFLWARQVNRTIRQNYGWAWIYNVIAIPLAMAGLLTPLIAVSAMLLSSLSVIGNTLRLVRRPANASRAVEHHPGMEFRSRL